MAWGRFICHFTGHDSAGNSRKRIADFPRDDHLIARGQGLGKPRNEVRQGPACLPVSAGPVVGDVRRPGAFHLGIRAANEPSLTSKPPHRHRELAAFLLVLTEEHPVSLPCQFSEIHFGDAGRGKVGKPRLCGPDDVGVRIHEIRRECVRGIG